MERLGEDALPRRKPIRQSEPANTPHGGAFVVRRAKSPSTSPSVTRSALTPADTRPITRVTRPVPASARGKGFLTLMRNRYFLTLWLAQVISQTILNAANYGMIVLIAQQSKSFIATGGAIVAFSIPTALFAAPAGALVDRFDKRRVLWLSNGLRAVACFGFVVSLLVDQHALLPVYLLSFAVALISQFFAPAEGAAIPLLVHEDELVNALGLFNLTFAASQAAGLIVLGPLILAALPVYRIGQVAHPAVLVTPIMSLFLLIAILYAICVVLVLLIPRERLLNRVGRGPVRYPASETLRGIWDGIAEGWRFIRRDRALMMSLLQFSIGNTILAVVAMMAPRFVAEYFNQPPELAALVFLPAGVGLILGSILVPHAVKRIHSRKLVASGILMLASSIVLLAAVRWVAPVFFGPKVWLAWPYIVVILGLTFIIGLGFDSVNVPSQTVMQQRSPDWIKARVLALQLVVSNALTVPVIFLVGAIADASGLLSALVVVAVGIVIAGLSTVYLDARAEGPHRPGAGVRFPGRQAITRPMRTLTDRRPPRDRRQNRRASVSNTVLR